jgi:hypothetical protein
VKYTLALAASCPPISPLHIYSYPPPKRFYGLRLADCIRFSALHHHGGHIYIYLGKDSAHGSYLMLASFNQFTGLEAVGIVYLCTTESQYLVCD